MNSHVMQIVHALSVGGSEMLASAIASGGVDQGLRMSVCALHRDGALAPLLRARGVATHAMERADGFQPKLLARMYALFRRERVSVVLTHHFGQLFYTALGARLAGCRLIHVEHEHYALASPRGRRRLRLAARLAERVIGVSEEVVAFLIREVGLLPAKVTMIRNGVDTKRFAPPASVERIALGAPAGVPIIGTVGRLDPVKDHATLLAAFRLVRETVPGARLVIVGDGEMRAALDALVEFYGLGAHVTFLGERLDIAGLIPAFDVFVLPSFNEGLSLALLEAMACARPVVTTNVGAARDVIGDGAAGLLVPAKDPVAMAAAVLRVLRDPAAAARMGAAARRLMVERYDIGHTVADYLALCRGDGAAR